MLIENEFEVAAPVEKVWAYMLDVPSLVPCLPGAELVGDDGKGTYEGKVTTKMGPVKMNFTGKATITETNAAARRIVLSGSGSETKGKGTASMKVTSTLIATARGTKVKVNQDLQVSGAMAQFGRGMIADVTSVLMKSFAECIEYNINAQNQGGGSTAVRAAKPTSGFAIGVQAILMALKRFFGRFFGNGKK